MEIFSSQAPKFGNFQLTSPQNLEIFRSQAPQIWKFSTHKPPFQRKLSVHTPLPEKKLSAPPDCTPVCFLLCLFTEELEQVMYVEAHRNSGGLYRGDVSETLGTCLI